MNQAAYVSPDLAAAERAVAAALGMKPYVLKPSNRWYIYLLQCADNTLYCGITTNVFKRLDTHNEGKGAKYTRGRRPVKLLAYTGRMTRKAAAQGERLVKRTHASKKLNKMRLLETLRFYTYYHRPLQSSFFDIPKCYPKGKT